MDDLAERLARGDRAAFAELYDRCADRLHHYLTVQLGSRQDADDVLQEVFVRLVRLRGRLGKADNLPAYVFSMARNEAARHRARKSREMGKAFTLQAADLFEAGDEAAREAAKDVAEGLSQLTPEQREVVELKFYSGLTFRAIAEVTGVPLPTAATRYRTALRRLREWWERQAK